MQSDSCVLLTPIWFGGEMGFDKGKIKFIPLVVFMLCCAKVEKLGN